MKYTSTLIAVKDMDISKKFYHDVLGLDVVADYGANVTLEGGVSLQTLDTWKAFIQTENVVFHNNAGELYFEENDIDAFCKKLKTFEISYVHELFEHEWGQRVVRFYDPDRHIIEVGEPLDIAIFRFTEQGLSEEEIAVRMDIPLEFVRACLDK